MIEKNPSTKNIVNFIVRVTAIVFLLAVALFAQGKNFVFAQGALPTVPSVTTGAAAGVSLKGLIAATFQAISAGKRGFSES